MENLLPIGRFSKITRLTVKALRYYDETDLLKPALVDSETGYRYYSLAQAMEAERIRLLRSLDIPVEEIPGILRQADPAIVKSQIDRHRIRVENQVVHYRQVLASLETLLTEKGGLMRYEIRTRETVPQPLISVRTHIAMSNIGQEMGRAFGELYKYLGRSFRRPAGPPFSIYHDPEFKEEDCDIEICVPTKKLLAGKTNIIARELPAGSVAYTLHTGAYENIGSAYQALVGWIQEHGRETAGPPRETYLVGPTQTDDPAAFQTEIAWPLK